MLYCEKCRGIAPDSSARCPGCKSRRLRAVGGEDMVLLHRADQYTAQRLAQQFDVAGVIYEAELVGKGTAAYLYNSEVLPTDQNIYVRYSDLETAKELSAQMKETIGREQAGEEEFEDMPQKKRIAVQIISVIAFLLLVMVTVFGADALANWLKGIFGM